MHNNSNMRNKEMVINTCKILPFLKISRTHAYKMMLWIMELLMSHQSGSLYSTRDISVEKLW